MSIFDDQKEPLPDQEVHPGGSFVDGNQLWKLRARSGLRKRFEDPQQLVELAAQYLEWTDTTPLKEEKVFGTGLRAEISKMRAPTIAGFSDFLGISSRTWRDYRAREEFKEVVDCIEQAMTSRKLEGAAAGLLAGNIVARDIGLADRTKVEIEEPKTLTEEEQFEKLEQQIPFLIPMLRKLGYRIEKVEDD